MASLIQIIETGGDRIVVLHDGTARRVEGFKRTYDIAFAALASGRSLLDEARTRLGEEIDLDAAIADQRILPPIDHVDPAHCYLTGTGLTHLGSAEGRDKMHKAAAGGTMTDSMRMFMMGVEGGKPTGDAAGAQPEWFYKGDGMSMVATGAPLRSPAFAFDGSEEPEVAGIYVIDAGGVPVRLGFALANEFSDHVTERGNYLWLAHSKLRNAALGAELLLGALPDDIRGTSRVIRDGQTIWEKPFLSGEANMSHAITNLEHHHFKYAQFRRPGDVHVHFFGTATLSFADGITTQPGDVFEIEALPFTVPLRNALVVDAQSPVAVRAL